MRIHCIHWQDPGGDEIDVEYFCSADCMFDVLHASGIGASALAGRVDRASWGAWPGGAETDYDVLCSNCTQFLWRGLQSDTEDGIEEAVEEAYVAGFEDG